MVLLLHVVMRKEMTVYLPFLIKTTSHAQWNQLGFLMVSKKECPPPPSHIYIKTYKSEQWQIRRKLRSTCPVV